MRMTRRLFGLGICAISLASAGRAVAVAVPAPSATRLQADLAACLAGNPARAAFTVTAFESMIAPGSRDVVLRAHVRLDWAPGMRHTPLRASGATPELAYLTLRQHAIAAFGRVVPGFAPPVGSA